MDDENDFNINNFDEKFILPFLERLWKVMSQGIAGKFHFQYYANLSELINI